MLKIFDGNHYLYSQQKVKYDKNFKFKEGVYLTFEEFKNNAPSIKDFNVVRTSQFSNQVYLEYPCYDSIKKKLSNCKIEDCWGYSLNNSVYVSQGVGGHFFKLHIIGALIHYFALETYEEPLYDFFWGHYPMIETQQRIRSKEYLIVFDTGERFEFNYRNFLQFLEKNDPELYNQLRSAKRKKKMIYYFLLKYNEKNAIYFPK